MIRVSKTLRLDNSLEGLVYLKKAVLFIVMVYNCKIIQMKISKGNGKIQEQPGASFQMSPASGSALKSPSKNG